MEIEQLKYNIQRKKFEDECTSEGTELKNFDLYKRTRTNIIIVILSMMIIMFGLGIIYGALL